MVPDEYEVWVCDRHDPCIGGLSGCMTAVMTDSDAASLVQCTSDIATQLEELGFDLESDSGAFYASDALESICDLVQQYTRCLPAACCDFQRASLMNSTIGQIFASHGYSCEAQCGHDWLCYAYNEQYGQFEPLGLNSRLQFVKDNMNSSNVSISHNHQVESWSNFDGTSLRSKLGHGVGRVTSDASQLRLSTAARGLASYMRASVDEWDGTRGGSTWPTFDLKKNYDTRKISAGFWSSRQLFDLASKGAVKAASSSSFSSPSFRRLLDTGGQVSVEVEKRRILKLRMLHEEGLITKDEMTRGIDAVISSITADAD